MGAVTCVLFGAWIGLGGFGGGGPAQWWGAVRAVVVGGIASIVVTASAAGLFPSLRKADALTAETLMATDARLSVAKPVD